MECSHGAYRGSIEKPGSPALTVDIISRQSITEVFITAAAQEGEEPIDVFARVAEQLREQDAQVVAQEVFGEKEYASEGMAQAAEIFGPVTWPVTWVMELNGEAHPVTGTQVWAISGTPIAPLELDGEVVGTLFEDDIAQYCRLGSIVPTDVSAASGEQTRQVFEKMEAALQAAGFAFSDVIRTWFYNDHILDWYGEFNQVRDKFFRERGIFDGLVPASTGIGGGNPAGAKLLATALAVKAKVDSVESYPIPSPLQCPALEYGSSFSRAVEMSAPGVRRVYISGTASIAPEGHTVHLDDMKNQVGLTMDVVNAILQSRDMSWDDVTRATAYYRDPGCGQEFDSYCSSRSISLPSVLVNNDVCRGDLLFEIELDAVLVTDEE